MLCHFYTCLRLSLLWRLQNVLLMLHPHTFSKKPMPFGFHYTLLPREQSCAVLCSFKCAVIHPQPHLSLKAAGLYKIPLIPKILNKKLILDYLFLEYNTLNPHCWTIIFIPWLGILVLPDFSACTRGPWPSLKEVLMADIWSFALNSHLEESIFVTFWNVWYPTVCYFWFLLLFICIFFFMQILCFILCVLMT